MTDADQHNEGGGRKRQQYVCSLEAPHCIYNVVWNSVYGYESGRAAEAERLRKYVLAGKGGARCRSTTFQITFPPCILPSLKLLK